jgi:hypothetical protein
MDIKKYFEKNGGIFTALAIFTTFMFIVSSQTSGQFLAFAGFFISFVLICYLLNDMRELNNIWFGLLFIGYNLLFIASLIFGLEKFQDLLNKNILTNLVIGIIVIFYGWIIIKLLIRTFKN